MHSRNPQVSVIIPAYQGERHISQAISSVLAQTFTDWEIIVVDDGSTDRTREVLQPYWEKVRYAHQENQGVAAARNCGISRSRGKWIAFLDQDDEFLPDKLATQMACVQNLPKHQTDVGIVHSGWQITSDRAEVLGEVFPWQGIRELTLASWVRQKPVFLGAMLFDRQWLAQVGGFDTQWQQTSDVDLVLRLAAIGCRAIWVRQPTVRYRQHEGNVSRNAKAQAQEIKAVLDRFFDRPHLPPEIAALEAASRYQSWVWSAARLQAMGDIRGMVECLEKSLPHSPYGMSETILDWVQGLEAYGGEYGREFDAIALTSLPEWQQLMVTVRTVFAPSLKMI
ncbi:MAG: glycosyltransferase family A protein [Cyanobacteriota bacterium]|nr:glycosyltransferase family A protein [Cyanobacteriota bacterium]